MSGHQERLSVLAAKYTLAAVDPHQFYFPFNEVPDTQRAATIATGLKAASDCIGELVDECTVDSSCNASRIYYVETLAKACPNLNIDSLDSSLKAFSTAAVSQSSGLAKAKDSNTASSLRNQIASWLGVGSTVAPTSWSAYDTYYRLLLVAPIIRVAGSSGAEMKDEANQIVEYCRFKKILPDNDCLQLLPTTITSAPVANASAVYRSWALNDRIGSLSSFFCAENLRSPMCLTASRQTSLAEKLEFKFATDRNFTIVPTLAPVAVAEVPKKKCTFIVLGFPHKTVRICK